MKNILYFLFLILILVSCTSNTISSLEGSWIDKESEFIKYTVIHENNEVWLQAYDRKIKVEQSSNNNFVTIDKIRYPIVFKEGKNILLIGDKVFIPENSSLKKQFIGVWENSEKNVLFEITEVNGGLYWDITVDKNKKDRYYPKLTNEGFTFTYDNEQIYFVLKKDFIEDSNGMKYFKETKS